MKHKAICIVAWLALLCVVGGLAWGETFRPADMHTAHEDNVFHLQWTDNGK